MKKHNLSEQVGVYRRSDHTKLKLDKHPLIPLETIIGSLTVIENGLYMLYGANPILIRACRFRCECGTEIVRGANSVRRTKHPSCGCQGHKTRKEQHALIPIGTKVHRWTVVENDLYKTYGKTKARACRVRCECGNEKILWSAYLLDDRSKSCGCHMPPPKYKRGIDQIWHDLYMRHVERDNGFHLTLSELKLLTQMNCSYCGKEPSNVYRLKYKYDGIYHHDSEKEIRCSGLDRVDSKKEYVHGNVVPCCWVCNRMKSAMPLGEFLDAIARIQRHNPSVDGILHQAATLLS